MHARGLSDRKTNQTTSFRGESTRAHRDKRSKIPRSRFQNRPLFQRLSKKCFFESKSRRFADIITRVTNYFVIVTNYKFVLRNRIKVANMLVLSKLPKLSIILLTVLRSQSFKFQYSQSFLIFLYVFIPMVTN